MAEASLALVILALARASKGSPERVILAGIAVGALLDSLVSILMASGDPRRPAGDLQDDRPA